MIYENENEITNESLIKSNAKISLIQIQNIYSIKEKITCFIHRRNFRDFQENAYMQAGFYFNSNDACKSYMYNQLILELFALDLLSRDQAKADLLDFCIEKKANYEKDFSEFKDSVEKDEFEFNSKKMIECYTKDSFFYHLINNTMRKDSFLDSYRIRYDVIMLRNGLKQYELSKQNFPNELFRAALIHEDELKLFDEAVKMIRKKLNSYAGLLLLPLKKQ